MAKKRRTTANNKFARVFSSGILPTPSTLQKYEQIMPGLAKMVVQNAERQTLHRLEIERKTLKSNAVKSFAGLIFGFLIGIFGLGGGFYLTFKGYNVIGIIFTSSTLVTLVMTFIYGSQSKRNGLQRKVELPNNP